MPVRPIRIIDLQPVPRRRRTAPPPLPARQPPFNWKPIAVAGSAALLLVGSLMLWAAKHPLRRAPVVAATTPTVAAVTPFDPTPPPVEPLVIEQAVPVQPPPAPQPARPAPAPIEPVAPARVEALVAAAPADDASVCATFGTSVEFDPNPVRAAKQAAKAQKLLMVLHVSGNFEDSAFT